MDQIRLVRRKLEERKGKCIIIFSHLVEGKKKNGGRDILLLGPPYLIPQNIGKTAN